MNTEHIKEITKGIEKEIGWNAKRELIQMIQELQGETLCYQTGKRYCNQFDCGWRKECLSGKGDHKLKHPKHTPVLKVKASGRQDCKKTL